MTQARTIAENTPDSRDRYVDALRALSILVVVFGHWLMAGPEMAGGDCEWDISSPRLAGRNG